MDGATEFTNQGGKAPSYDQNKTLLGFHQEGEIPGHGPISLSGGEILGDFVRDDVTSCNQDGESLQKPTDNARAAMDDAASPSDQQCAELRGILDLGAGAFPSFEGDLFGSPDRDLFLSNDGGERSRSYPPSPTAPSFLSKADEPSGLTVLSLEGAIGGLRRAQISHGQLPSSLLSGLESGKEFQTIRLQDPNNADDGNEETGEITRECDSTPCASDFAERVMMFGRDVVDRNKADGRIGSSNPSVTATVSDLTMSPILTETMSTAVLNAPLSSPPNDHRVVSESAEHFPFVDLKSLPTSSSSTIVSLGEAFENNSNMLLNVANIEEEEPSQTEDGRLVYVITTKDQFSGSLSKIQVTVDPNAIQSIPSDSLTGGTSGEQWILGEQLLESGGGGDTAVSTGPQAVSSTLVFPNQVISPVIDVGDHPPLEKKAKQRRGKRPAKVDPGSPNMWLKKNQPQMVTVCPHPGCGLEFTSKTKFEAHSTRHAPDRPFKCTADGCEWCFPTNTKLQRHLFSHQGIKPYVCLERGCGKHFGSHYNLKTHEKAHRDAVVLQCPVDSCQETFQTQKKLQIHLREHFAETRLKCPVPGCDETFMTPNARGSHLRRHCQESKVYRCEYEGCNREFDKESRLIYHTRTHTGERPYKCTYSGCQWAFTSHQKLKRHECRHTGRKDFRCPLENCGKTFTRREHLQAHEVAHRGELPFLCKEPGCNARFSQRSSLHMHKKRHTSGKPGKVFLFSCALGDCNASFSTRQGLKNHIIKGHMDHPPMIDLLAMDTFDNESLSPPAETMSPSTTPSPVSIASSSVMSPQPDAVSVAMSSAMLSTLDVSETAQSTMSIQLPDVIQHVSLGGDQGAISLLSSINLPVSRAPSYPGSSSSKTDYCSLGKESPMFAMTSTDSLVQGKDLDVIDSSLLATSICSVTSSVVPTSFALISTSPLTLRDPATGAHFIHTQLLQDDPPDDTDMTFDLNPPTSTSDQSPIHGVLPVSSLMGDSDSCPVSTTADFLSSDPGVFEGSTINLQDLA